MSIKPDFAPLYGKKVLCAVSGGADSICLLHALKAAGIAVTAAHFEHGIRGEESERDLDFVRDFCLKWDIPFVFARADVPGFARGRGMSIEEAARHLRYEFLEQQRAQLGLDLIATAHNMEDNAETLLFNLSRGSGAKGLRGIEPVRGNIVRPLLTVSRAEILAYLEENSLPHVEDSTNSSDDYSRNFIRHNIMPLMQKLNPRFAQAAGRTAELMRRDEEALSQMAAGFIENELGEDDSISCQKLLSLSIAVSSRVLRMKLGGLSMEHVDAVLDFCRGDGWAEFDAPGCRLYRDMGRLFFTPPIREAIVPRRLIVGTSLTLPECGLVVESQIVEYSGEVNDLFKTSFLKYEIIGNELFIGSRLAGDSMRPAGRGCTKSLKSLFLEGNIARSLRDNIPVIRDENGILLVRGLALDERALPSPGDKALKLVFRNIFTGEQE